VRPTRRLLGLAVLVGAPIWLARRGNRREQLRLHFDDGSTVVLDAGQPEAARLLVLARQGL
jgi:hypothetical protein